MLFVKNASAMVLLVSIWPVAATAAETQKAVALQIDQLLACQKIEEVQLRLACFDAEAASLQSKLAGDEVAIVSQSEIKTARKGSFGFSVPNSAILAPQISKSADEEGLNYIDSTIKSARQVTDKTWLIELQDGARWQQSDSEIILTPRSGDTIRIRKGAFGSFSARINNRAAIRVRRIN